MTFSERVFNTGIVPVVVLNNVEDAVPLANALLKGGIDFMEITFRTECAAECIAKISKEVPEVVVGAGTVLNVEQAKLAVENGAKFIVSPGLDEETVTWAIGNNIPVIPGCVTPTEIMKAISLGLKVVKFFPADVYGGIKLLRLCQLLSDRSSSFLRAAYQKLILRTSSKTNQLQRSAEAGSARKTILQTTIGIR